MPIDIEHLPHIQGMIVKGIRAETGEAIIAKYTITDQLNATGEEAEAMRADILQMRTEGHEKQAAVLATTTFEELNEIVPEKVEE